MIALLTKDRTQRQCTPYILFRSWPICRRLLQPFQTQVRALCRPNNIQLRVYQQTQISTTMRDPTIQMGSTYAASFFKLTADFEQCINSTCVVPSALSLIPNVRLANTEKEADKARKGSKIARDQFHDVK
jgi:hypothetical protein